MKPEQGALKSRRRRLTKDKRKAREEGVELIALSKNKKSRRNRYHNRSAAFLASGSDVRRPSLSRITANRQQFSRNKNPSREELPRYRVPRKRLKLVKVRSANLKQILELLR